MGFYGSRKSQNIQRGSELIQNDKTLLQAPKSICKIETKSKLCSGFLKAKKNFLSND